MLTQNPNTKGIRLQRPPLKLIVVVIALYIPTQCEKCRLKSATMYPPEKWTRRQKSKKTADGMDDGSCFVVVC
uniref:Secreted protein n=1 Tax=Panagrellus redivivus TaxID=6233 RepID=A0A7E4V6U1_PANRE